MSISTPQLSSQNLKIWRFAGLLTEKGWLEPGFLLSDDSGKILDVNEKKEKLTGNLSHEALEKIKIENVNGYALPGMPNGHSHAFQYAMAGLAESASIKNFNDSFWSWRKSMYELALRVDADSLYHIARALYSEMLYYGYTSVVEFHYLQDTQKGLGQAPRIEMSEALIRAANDVGIHLTLTPVFYSQGGFNKKARPEQSRFLFEDTSEYLDFLEQLKNNPSVKNGETELGQGVHSLRAASKEQIKEIVDNRLMGSPFHIHIAEQILEVEECLHYYKKRPVEFLLTEFDITPDFNLVHSTHVNDEELHMMAVAQTNVVLCATTEANLGDGLFPLIRFEKLGGHWSIGSDNHVCLSPWRELQLVEYGQRLDAQRRNVLCNRNELNSGELLFRRAFLNGQNSAGSGVRSYFERGRPLNALVVSKQSPMLASRNIQQILSTLIFTQPRSPFLGTITNGKWRVENGCHVHQEEISKLFSKELVNLTM